jgi:hypothetical protein
MRFRKVRINIYLPVFLFGERPLLVEGETDSLTKSEKDRLTASFFSYLVARFFGLLSFIGIKLTPKFQIMYG